MIALVRDRRDDPGLPRIPADDGNFGERAQFRARAVGGDDQRARSRPRPGKLDARDVAAGREADDRALIVSTPSAAARAASALATSSANAIWASGSPSRASNVSCSSRAASLDAPSAIAICRIGCAQRLQRLPGADALDEAARPRRQRHRAQTAVALAGARIDDGDGGAAPQRLAHRRRER